MTQFLVLIALIAVVGVPLWFRSRQDNELAGIVGDVLPVWAALGPFTCGEESAAAMRYASMAIIGPEKTERLGDAFKNHALSYDRDGLSWEKLRDEAISRGTSGALMASSSQLLLDV